jgi:hypothetical protein
MLRYVPLLDVFCVELVVAEDTPSTGTAVIPITDRSLIVPSAINTFVSGVLTPKALIYFVVPEIDNPSPSLNFQY